MALNIHLRYRYYVSIKMEASVYVPLSYAGQMCLGEDTMP